MDPITMISAGFGIVKAIKSIVPFFGDKGAKVAEAIDTIEGAVADVKEKRISPEGRAELAIATTNRDVQLAAQQIKEMQFVYDDAAGGREVIKTALLSDDPLVRQARPKMMLLIGKSCIAFTFYAPVSVIAAGHAGLDAAVMTDYMSALRWIGAFLFSAFMTSFTGYTVGRSVDKKTASGETPGTVLNMAAAIGRRLS